MERTSSTSLLYSPLSVILPNSVLLASAVYISFDLPPICPNLVIFLTFPKSLLAKSTIPFHSKFLSVYPTFPIFTRLFHTIVLLHKSIWGLPLDIFPNAKGQPPNLFYFSFFTESRANSLGEWWLKEKSMEQLVID